MCGRTGSGRHGSAPWNSPGARALAADTRTPTSAVATEGDGAAVTLTQLGECRGRGPIRKLSMIWWKGRDSNPRPRHYESSKHRFLAALAHECGQGCVASSSAIMSI